MHQNRRRPLILSAACGAAAVLAAGALALLAPGTAARAQQQNLPPVTFGIFRGETGESGNVRLGSWGSGRAEETKDNVLVGDSAIRVTTHGLYQGARLDFRNPIDLSSALMNPKTYVRMQVRFAGSTQTNFDPSNPQLGNQVLAAPFDKMRFLLTMADGTQYELVRPVVIPPSEDPDAYVPITFPVAAILKKGSTTLPAPAGDAAKLKTLSIFGDKYQQFTIGEINVITDDTEISVEPLEDQIAFINDVLTFSGIAEGGATTLRYSWDFDAKDGVQEDAVGRNVTHFWRAPGKYTVTLTVSDEDGLKKPQTTSIDIEVGA
ncbi:MAG TPA: PKD domain-containing protein [Armatimonadaceae bacterium]|nr:PKD domain-containing protein [Armatimonadaceae bacterium]